MRTRSKRQTTALATAKSKAKQLTLETNRLANAQYRNSSRDSSRSLSPTPTSASSTPPPSPRAVPGTFGGPRQDTLVSGFRTSYTIGLAVYPLKQEDRKDLARHIISCKARGNAFAADIMRRQLEDILADERTVWRRQEEQDKRIALDQLQLLRSQKVGTDCGSVVSNWEDTQLESDSDCESMVD